MGIGLCVLGLAQPAWAPVIDGGPWLAVGVGMAYAAAAAAAWLVLDRDRNSMAIALAPAVLAPVSALLAYGSVIEVLTISRPAITAAILVVFGIALAFPLGAATAARRQWAVLGLFAVAALALIAIGLPTLAPGPPEDRDLLVLIGMIALIAATLPAIGTYALGRLARSGASADDPSPYPPLLAAALPFGLTVAGLLARPLFATETVVGPLLVAVPVVALAVIALQLARVSGRLR